MKMTCCSGKMVVASSDNNEGISIPPSGTCCTRYARYTSATRGYTKVSLRLKYPRPRDYHTPPVSRSFGGDGLHLSITRASSVLN